MVYKYKIYLFILYIFPVKVIASAGANVGAQGVANCHRAESNMLGRHPHLPVELIAVVGGVAASWRLEERLAMGGMGEDDARIENTPSQPCKDSYHACQW